MSKNFTESSLFFKNENVHSRGQQRVSIITELKKISEIGIMPFVRYGLSW